jgi:hypothetical protein
LIGGLFMTANAETPADGPAAREDLKLALDYTWGWFALHSNQRMQLMNYLILSFAFATAAYATAAGWKQFWVAAGVALIGVLISVVFERLDVRTRQLVQVSEKTLIAIEHELAQRAHLSDLDFVDVVATRPRFTSYRSVLRVLTRVGAATFLAGLVFALIKAF